MKRIKKEELSSLCLKNLYKKLEKIERAVNYLEKERIKLMKDKMDIRIKIKKEKEVLRLKEQIERIKIRKK